MSENKKFDAADLVHLQTAVFPLVKMFGGPDIPDIMQAGSEPLLATGHVLHQAAEIFDVAGAALADGHLSLDEINAVVAEAMDVPQAIEMLRSKIRNVGGADPQG